MKFGIDISRWQGMYDFEQALREGIKFAIFRCGGADDKNIGMYYDSTYRRNYAECARVGIARGVYYLLDAESTDEAAEQARHCLSLIEEMKLQLPVFADVEGEALDADNLTEIINRFCEVIKEAGYDAGVYASASPMINLMDIRAIKEAGNDVWCASYTAEKPEIGVDIDIWQYGGGSDNFIRDVHVAGQAVDQNFAYKDYDFNVAPEQTDDIPDNETPDTNKYNGVKIRFTGTTDIYGTYITAWHNEDGYDVDGYDGETMRLTHDGVVFAVVKESDVEVIGSVIDTANDNVIKDGMLVRFTGNVDINGTPLKIYDRIYTAADISDGTVVLMVGDDVYARVYLNDVTPADSQPAEREPENYEEERTATVQPGGSFWQIANDFLGDGNRAAELAEYNNMTLESGLYVGMVLRLPQ
ncbi:MAG: GH25 family lysozyme [Lachnospira sp.]